MTALAKVLTVSDGVVAGVREDKSGRALEERLRSSGYTIAEARVISDGVDEVATAITEMAEGFAGLVVTTGGTGFGPRDLTPEGTQRALVNPLGRLSRGVSGTVGRVLVLNLPGSPSAAVECLEAVLDVVPHALSLLQGDRPH
jgi:molybdenum cofactor synthesis domain-containing protein